ncbi:MAG: family 20 glycosylhydrolase [Marinifilaceae bacterium]
MTKKLFLTITLCLLSIITALAQINEKPFVVPELQKWQGSKGNFTMSQGMTVSVDKKNGKELLPIAEQFIADVEEMFGYKLRLLEAGNNGAIQFEIGRCGTDNAEGYMVKIGTNVKVVSNEPVGAYWATRTLLQMLEGTKGSSLPKGTITDYPNYPVRGFMFDVARKYVRLPFLQDYVKFMAYYKMNTFHIHLNDNGFKQYFEDDWSKTPAAFRLESTTYPGLASEEGHYTKQEFIDLQKMAEAHFVNIVPEIDIPAHTLAFAHYKPELGSKEYGMDHLDLSNPNIYPFFDALFKEYLEGNDPVFRGKVVHIGTDEYSNKDKKVVEQFRKFTDHYIREVQKYGKTAGVWGALTHAQGDTPVTVDNVLMDCWYNGFADPKEMIKQGYNVVSIPDGLVYIVPAAGYYYDYLNCKHLYDKWTPATIGNQEFEERHPQIKGGKFAVWNDHCGNGISEKDIHHRVWPAMQTMSQKMWKGAKTTMPYETFNNKAQLLSEAPGVNQLGKVRGVKGIVFTADTLKPGAVSKFVEAGYGYKVKFKLHSKDNLNGAVLFESPNAKVYLRDPKTGNISFERDGYRYSFNYAVPNDETVELMFVGDNTSTTLFVNNKEVSKLAKKELHYGQNGKTKMFDMPTLVFPTQKCGKFNGLITNFSIEQL